MAAEPLVQCSTGPFWAFELERAMDALAQAGFRDIELMVTRDPRTHEPELPRKLAEERGLRIASVHAPFLVVTKLVWGPDPVQKIRRGIEMCRAVGASTLIVHPPHLWEQGYAHWIRNELASVSLESGVDVAVETMYPKWVAGRRMRVYRWIDPRELYEASPIVALDTSHVTVARIDMLEAYTTLLPKLAHIHLSNNAGDGRDGHLELDRGILPMDRFLDTVRRTGYSGGISLELTVRTYIERPEEMAGMLRRNREYIAARLGRTRVTKGLPRR